MAAMAAAAHLGASSCYGARPSLATIPGGASSRSHLSFDRALRRHCPRSLFHCVAEDTSAVPPATPEPDAKPDAKPVDKPANKPTAKAVVSKRPTYSMNKGQIVRVDKEKYLNSIEYYAVDHPKFFKGIDYIYEDRGEILDLRNFEAGEYALITWAGIPTAPAWLPTYMLIKSEKLSYKRT